MYKKFRTCMLFKLSSINLVGADIDVSKNNQLVVVTATVSGSRGGMLTMLR